MTNIGVTDLMLDCVSSYVIHSRLTYLFTQNRAGESRYVLFRLEEGVWWESLRLRISNVLHRHVQMDSKDDFEERILFKGSTKRYDQKEETDDSVPRVVQPKSTKIGGLVHCSLPTSDTLVPSTSTGKDIRSVTDPDVYRSTVLHSRIIHNYLFRESGTNSRSDRLDLKVSF